jgi:hypothetical protein
MDHEQKGGRGGCSDGGECLILLIAESWAFEKAAIAKKEFEHNAKVQRTEVVMFNYTASTDCHRRFKRNSGVTSPTDIFMSFFTAFISFFITFTVELKPSSFSFSSITLEPSLSFCWNSKRGASPARVQPLTQAAFRSFIYWTMSPTFIPFISAITINFIPICCTILFALFYTMFSPSFTYFHI